MLMVYIISALVLSDHSYSKISTEMISIYILSRTPKIKFNKVKHNPSSTLCTGSQTAVFIIASTNNNLCTGEPQDFVANNSLFIYNVTYSSRISKWINRSKCKKNNARIVLCH